MRSWNRNQSSIGLVCKDCTDREVGCHGKCERYKDALATRDRKQKELREMHKVENEWISYSAHVARTRK